MPHTIRASCRLEAGREGASWERRCSTACPVDGVASLTVPAIAQVQPVAAIFHVQRWRIVQDRLRLWKQGVRDLVLDISCVLHHCLARLTPWQPAVAAGYTHAGSASRPALPPARTSWDHTMSALACASRCVPLEGCFSHCANGSYHILTGESEQSFSSLSCRLRWHHPEPLHSTYAALAGGLSHVSARARHTTDGRGSRRRRSESGITSPNVEGSSGLRCAEDKRRAGHAGSVAPAVSDL
jgi:hypothetical protein